MKILQIMTYIWKMDGHEEDLSKYNVEEIYAQRFSDEDQTR